MVVKSMHDRIKILVKYWSDFFDITFHVFIDIEKREALPD